MYINYFADGPGNVFCCVSIVLMARFDEDVFFKSNRLGKIGGKNVQTTYRVV